MLEEDELIWMTTAKRAKEPRRPEMARYRMTDSHLIQGPIQGPNALAILRVNNQIFTEAAPIVYGNNHFHFNDFRGLKTFLDSIGDMRQYIRHIHLGTLTVG